MSVPILRCLTICASIAALVATAAGCSRRDVCYPVTGFALGPVDVERCAELPPIQYDARQIPPFQQLAAELNRTPVSGPFRCLRDFECQCIAVRNASLANLLQLEIDLLEECSSDRGLGAQQSALEMQRTMLALRAHNQRNLAASEALESLYQLAEAEQQSRLLTDSIAELNRALDYVRQLEDQGLQIDVDRSSLQQQRLGLVESQVQLATTIQQLNGKLRVLLYLDPRDLTPLWPVADWTPRFEAVDIDSAIARGLQSRADLAILRMALWSLDDPGTAPLAEQTLRQADAALAFSTSGHFRLLAALRARHDDCQIFYRRQQLAQLEQHHTRTIVEEIRQRAFAVEGELKSIAAWNERVQGLEMNRANLRSQREANGVTAFDITAATLEILKAKGELLSHVIAYKIARVQLAQAMGLLPVECGYDLPAWQCMCGACGGCCDQCGTDVWAPQGSGLPASPSAEPANLPLHVGEAEPTVVQ